jgi:hypothetical protein
MPSRSCNTYYFEFIRILTRYRPAKGISSSSSKAARAAQQQEVQLLLSAAATHWRSCTEFKH